MVVVVVVVVLAPPAAAPPAAAAAAAEAQQLAQWAHQLPLPSSTPPQLHHQHPLVSAAGMRQGSCHSWHNHTGWDQSNRLPWSSLQLRCLILLQQHSCMMHHCGQAGQVWTASKAQVVVQVLVVAHNCQQQQQQQPEEWSLCQLRSQFA